ncbi:MAG: HAD family hydrolase [Verrucomicrobia bacterium]|nr:HAD family hydrolase [Verrucomicrobiota bacterium]
MLIIFDLDDTLVDTSGCLTHYKLEEALQAMIREGMEIPHFDEALEMLRRLDRHAESARSSLSEFIEILGADSRFLEIGVKTVYDTPCGSLSLFPLEGALDLLQDLSKHHELALVTVGSAERQTEKLKKAGIDTGLFSKIAVLEERNKKMHYQVIAEGLGYAPSQVLVCGDRIPVDLTPARELGFKTVQMQWGRGVYAGGGQGDVDYRIAALPELKKIVTELMTFSLH